jgi:hypothetical protein
VQVVKTPLYGADGAFMGLQGIFWDITQQRLAEEKIRRVNALLAQSRKELRARNAQMEDDLKMAREIQVTMLPQQYPAFPHSASPSESAFQFTHRYLPAGSVGGDFFSVSALSEDEAGVFICDVAGHGVRSALVTAMIRALAEELKPVAKEPGQFLNKLNSDLHAILKHTGTPMLTTAFYLVANWRTGKMRYANAGHPKPLHIRRSSGQVPQARASRCWGSLRNRPIELPRQVSVRKIWSCCSRTGSMRSRTVTKNFTPRQCSSPGCSGARNSRCRSCSTSFWPRFSTSRRTAASPMTCVWSAWSIVATARANVSRSKN